MRRAPVSRRASPKREAGARSSGSGGVRALGFGCRPEHARGPVCKSCVAAGNGDERARARSAATAARRRGAPRRPRAREPCDRRCAGRRSGASASRSRRTTVTPKRGHDACAEHQSSGRPTGSGAADPDLTPGASRLAAARSIADRSRPGGSGRPERAAAFGTTPRMGEWHGADPRRTSSLCDRLAVRSGSPAPCGPSRLAENTRRSAGGGMASRPPSAGRVVRPRSVPARVPSPGRSLERRAGRILPAGDAARRPMAPAADATGAIRSAGPRRV